MVANFMRTSGEIFQRHRRLFTHAIYAGLAVMQFGCASVHTVSDKPSLPPETQAAILNGIKQSTNNVPFRLMSEDDYDSLMTPLKETWRDVNHYTLDQSSTTEQGQALEEEVTQSREKMLAFIEEHSKEMFAEQNHLEEGWKDKIDFGELLERSSHYEGTSGARAAILSVNPDALRLLVLKNIDEPLAPSINETEFFGKTLGLPDLDKVMGPHMAEVLRAYAVWHEAEHIGDTRNLVGTKEHPNPESESRALAKEIYADMESLEKYCQITGDTEIVRVLMHFRALSCIITSDPDHATQFELAKLLHKLDPSEKEHSYVNRSDTYKAMNVLRRTQGQLPRSIYSFWKTDKTKIREGVQFRYQELANFIEGKNINPRQAEQLSDPDVQKVLVAAWKGWQFFDEKLRTAGKPYSVSPPQHMVILEAPAREDVRGFKTPVFRADAALK